MNMNRTLEDRIENFIAEAQSHVDYLRETTDNLEYTIALFSKANYFSKSNKIEERLAGDIAKTRLVNLNFDAPTPSAIEEEMMKAINKNTYTNTRSIVRSPLTKRE